MHCLVALAEWCKSSVCGSGKPSSIIIALLTCQKSTHRCIVPFFFHNYDRGYPLSGGHMLNNVALLWHFTSSDTLFCDANGSLRSFTMTGLLDKWILIWCTKHLARPTTLKKRCENLSRWGSPVHLKTAECVALNSKLEVPYGINSQRQCTAFYHICHSYDICKEANTHLNYLTWVVQ